MVKLVKSVFVKIITIIIILLVIAYFSLDYVAAAIIKANIEEKLTAKVDIAKVDISYVPLGIDIKGISIENLKETDPWKKMELKEIGVRVKASSLNTDTIIVNYVNVDTPSVKYDLGELGLTDVAGNVGKKVVGGIISNAILGPASLGVGIAKMGIDGVKAIKENSDEQKQQEANKIARANSGEKKFIIKKIFINDMQLTPTSKVLWLEEGSSVRIPDIELEYVDENSGDDIVRHTRDVIKKAIVAELTRLKSNKAE